LNCIQRSKGSSVCTENVIRGGQRGRSAQGRRLQTCPVGIDRSVSLNRALWMLAEEMRKLKG